MSWGLFLESPDNKWAPKAVVVYMKERNFNSFLSSMIKLSVNETKWTILLARTRALILFISIWIFDFGPEKLSGLWRNGPLKAKMEKFKTIWFLRKVRSPFLPKYQLSWKKLEKKYQGHYFCFTLSCNIRLRINKFCTHSSKWMSFSR